MRGPKRTDEERAAWRAGMRDLAAKVRAMSPAELEAAAVQVGTVTCQGHPLSPFNCVFLASQSERPCVMVGGFRQWQAIGRQVKKGEHAIGRIWVPKGKAKSEAGDGQGEATDEKERQGFLLVPVFDVSQTEEAQAKERGAA